MYERIFSCLTKLPIMKKRALFNPRSVTALLLLIFTPLSLITVDSIWHFSEIKRQAYHQLLAEHPFNNRENISSEALKAMPKKDRPDLAYEQNFLLTMDPALSYPPSERLALAFNFAQAKRAAMQVPGMMGAVPGINWEERGPSNVGGRTRVVMYDPNDGTVKKVFAAGVGGGLWYTDDITDAGEAWTKVSDFWDNIAVSTLAFDPSSTLTFYAGTGEGWYNIDAIRGAGIFKSTDGGISWAQLASTNNSNFYYIQKVVVHPTNGDVYASTRTNGVYRSQDGGSTWVQVLGAGNGSSTDRAADLEFGADNTIFASMGIFTTDGIYRSSTGDAGDWTKLNTGGSGFPTSGFHRIELATAPSDANYLYAITQHSSNYGVEDIYRSTNKGTNWSARNVPVDDDPGIGSDFTRSQAWYDLIGAVDPNDRDNLFVGGIDLFKSTNGGNSWTQISHWYGGFGYPEVHADQHAITFKPGSSSEVVFGNDGGVFYTADANTSTPSFTNRNNDYNVTQFYACAIDPDAGDNYFLAGSQDNGSHKFDSPGIDATDEVTGGDGAFCFIDQTDDLYQVTSYVYNVYYRSTDGGGSFSLIQNSQSTGSFINPTDYDDREDHLFSARTTTTLNRIRNLTGSYSTGSISVNQGGSKASHIRVSPFAPVGTSTLFVGTEGGRLYKVTDADASPSTNEITGGSFPSGSISCVEIGANENELLVTFSNYGVNSIWYSADGGSIWNSKEGDLPDMPVRWALFNPNNREQVILATELGVWVTYDLSSASPEWDPSNSGLANTRVDMLQTRTSDNNVIAATHGRGLFSTDDFGFPPMPVPAFIADEVQHCVNADIQFTDQSTNAPTQWKWYFGDGDSSILQHPTHSYAATGFYTVQLIATNAGGCDTAEMINYIEIVEGDKLKTTQGFESATFPPTDWALDNPDSDKTWERNPSYGGEGISSACMYINNFSYAGSGQVDEMTLQIHDFDCYNNTELVFKHAYTYNSGGQYDSLKIYISNDCGSTYNLVFNKGGDDLKTRPAMASEFFPAAGEWDRDTVDLTAYVGQSNIMIKFAAVNDNGNNLYVDDIQVLGILVDTLWWQGTISSDWHDPDNWDKGALPIPCTTVMIWNPMHVTTMPVVSAPAECWEIYLDTGQGGTLDFGPGGSVDIYRND